MKPLKVGIQSKNYYQWNAKLNLRVKLYYSKEKNCITHKNEEFLKTKRQL